MKALIYKDLMSLKKTGFFSLIILALVSIHAVREGYIALLPMIFLLMPVILLGIIFGSDQQAHVDVYIIPGPIKRSTIVLSRYVLLWSMALLGTLFTFLLKTFSANEAFFALPSHLIIAIMPLLSTLMAVIQIPLMYKFGAEKARLIFAILYFILFALFSYLGSKKELIAEFLSNLAQLNLALVSLLIIALTLALNVLSLVLSVTIYTKQDF